MQVIPSRYASFSTCKFNIQFLGLPGSYPGFPYFPLPFRSFALGVFVASECLL